MRLGQTVHLHSGSGTPVAATVLAITGNGPMPTCYKVLKLKDKDDKVHDDVVYYEDRGSKTKFWSLVDDKVKPLKKSSK